MNVIREFDGSKEISILSKDIKNYIADSVENNAESAILTFQSCTLTNQKQEDIRNFIETLGKVQVRRTSRAVEFHYPITNQ